MVFIMAVTCNGVASRLPCPKLKLASCPLWASSSAPGRAPLWAIRPSASPMLRPKPRYMQPLGLNSMLKYRRSPADGQKKNSRQLSRHGIPSSPRSSARMSRSAARSRRCSASSVQHICAHARTPQLSVHSRFPISADGTALQSGAPLTCGAV